MKLLVASLPEIRNCDTVCSWPRPLEPPGSCHNFTRLIYQVEHSLRHNPCVCQHCLAGFEQQLTCSAISKEQPLVTRHINLYHIFLFKRRLRSGSWSWRWQRCWALDPCLLCLAFFVIWRQSFILGTCCRGRRVWALIEILVEPCLEPSRAGQFRIESVPWKIIVVANVDAESAAFGDTALVARARMKLPETLKTIEQTIRN